MLRSLPCLFLYVLAALPPAAGHAAHAPYPTAQHWRPDTQQSSSTTTLDLSTTGGRNISASLFARLEELSRVVDIAYCVGSTGLGISKPFKCLGRCDEFPTFELVKTWNTGPLLSDSCGYIALSHGPSPPRLIVAFRGTYSITNTIADLSTVPQEYDPYPGGSDSDDPDNNPNSTLPRCANCTVHMGFHRSWRNTRSSILPAVEAARHKYPDYALTLVGHSLGGAVALLAALDFKGRGWDPRVTTFGEPRAGNEAFVKYVDEVFGLDSKYRDAEAHGNGSGDDWKYHRVTHVGDPVPLLPLEEWGYRMHAGEVFVTRPELPPVVGDLRACTGDEDPGCIANNADKEDGAEGAEEEGEERMEKMGLWDSWDRLKLWQLLFAHRDYFWRLGLCVPGGDPWDWGRERPMVPGNGEEEKVSL